MLTHSAARQKLAAMLDIDVESNSDFRQHCTDWLNAGGRRVWESCDWFGRKVETIVSTVAPYVTGSITTTQGSASITGSTTVWTTAMTGRKIALGIGNPWYRFTYVSGTSGTLGTTYAEASGSGLAYSIFQDEFDLPSDAEAVVDVSLVSAIYRGQMRRMTEMQMDDSRYVNPSSGPPFGWAPTLDQTANVRRIRVTPVPDSVYRLRVLYVKAYTDLVGDGDISVLYVGTAANRERAWMLASALEAQRSADVRQVTSDGEVIAAISEAYKGEQQQTNSVVRRVPLGSGVQRGLFYVNDDNATN